MRSFVLLFFSIFLFAPGVWAEASTLTLSPATGVYTTGSTFSVRVVVNTKGSPINAADATLSFNPKELQVVSISKGSSIFNLWTAEPSFSNSAGTVSFSGGTPTGYTGSSGTVLSITFRTLGAGEPRVTMSSGSVLAADGRGTNVLTSMGSGAYTISAVTSTPEPEEIVEYVPPANTPSAPKITSDTHANPDGWSKEKQAVLRFAVPSDVVAVRTLLDEFAGSIPTKVYDSPISEITLPDLPDGVSYFHIQFKNEEGWGKVTHYRLAVDSTAPTGLTLSLAPDSNLANPQQTIIATTTDTVGAPIVEYKVQLNGAESKQYKNEDNKGLIALTELKPGRQSLVVEAVDAAGNSSLSTFTFDIESFAAPRFDDVPVEVNTGVIPVFLGTTRPKARVQVTLSGAGLVPHAYEVMSDESGAFRFIPEGKLSEGVYSLSAVATDEFGAQSVESDAVSFVVRPGGLLRIGSFLISVFSVLIPLVALALFSVLGVLYFMARYRRFRSVVGKESREVVETLHERFHMIEEVIATHEAAIVAGRKTKKLTATEASLLADLKAVVESAEVAVEKEVSDVTKLAR